MSPRSYEELGPGQQLYRVIEFCQDPRVLYDKIETGHWESLGVRESRGRTTYVLGRPRRTGVLEGRASGTAIPAGVADGRNRVEVHVPHPTHRVPSASWHATPDDARAEFARLQKALLKESGPGIYRLRLFLDDRLENEKLVIRTLPNYSP